MLGDCTGHTGATAIVDEVMTVGVHFAEVKLHSGSQMAFGVALSSYEPPEADLPSEPDAQEGEIGGGNGDWRQVAGVHRVSQPNEPYQSYGCIQA